VLVAAGCRDRARDLRVGDLVFSGKVGSEGFFLFFLATFCLLAIFFSKWLKVRVVFFGFFFGFLVAKFQLFFFENFSDFSIGF
jgi:hypothetical protein